MTTDAVTGATSYTGRFIAERLVEEGRAVVDLTRSPRVPHPLGEAVTSAALHFGDQAGLAQALAGVDTLYNTFWIRFERGPITYEWAIERSRILFALVAVKRLCVGDLALALGVSEDAVSYGLKLLRTAGLVTFRKQGRIVYYSLADAFPHPLLEHCLRQLLQISSGEGVRP